MNMNKRILYSIIFSVLGLTTSCGSNNDSNENVEPEKETLALVKYVSDNTEFANPERGFYTQLEGNMTTPVSESRLRELRNDKKSLVMLMYYMKEYRNADLGKDVIAKLSADLDKVRNTGLKAIIRFAYTNEIDGEDAPLDRILKHLDELKPLFAKNKDVIACAQAGFIGAWGEWYYSTNRLNNTAAYNAVIKKWLEVLPTDRCVQVRTPKYKQDYLNVKAGLTPELAYAGTPAARIAHHNDAFMADENNMGTYADVKVDKAYIAEEGLYLPIGGETCLPSPSAAISTGAAAVTDLSMLHWSFLNDAYDKKVLNKWESEGYMTDIKNKLGYRVSLLRGEYSTKHQPGSDFVCKLSLLNLGYAAMYNPRDIYVVLRSESNNQEYWAKLKEDPRTWKPLRSAKLKLEIALPTDIPAGKYKAFLFLPDPEPTLAKRPEYAVRLANKDMWEEKTGYNDLNVSITVDANGNLPASKSSLHFVKK
uniref:DUF4832 domain-containing protein n=1 Tax=Prevotella sp. GTC17262 TaxID=3236797 RepID=A0AB33JS13_9BACT